MNYSVNIPAIPVLTNPEAARQAPVAASPIAGVSMALVDLDAARSERRMIELNGIYSAIRYSKW